MLYCSKKIQLIAVFFKMEMYYFKNHSKTFFDYGTKLYATDIYIKNNIIKIL